MSFFVKLPNGTEQEILDFNVSIGGVETHIETLTDKDGNVLASKPTITTQPTGTTIDDTQTATLTVVADGVGSTMSYQWYMNDSAISGATAASYTFTPSSTGTYSFYCRVSGFGGYTQTDPVNVVVNQSAKTYAATITSAEWITDIWGWTLMGDEHDEGDFSPRTFSGFTGTVSFNPRCQLGAGYSVIGDKPQFNYYLNSSENTGTDKVDILYEGGVAIRNLQRDPPDGPVYMVHAENTPKGMDLWNALRSGGNVSIQIKISRGLS